MRTARRVIVVIFLAACLLLQAQGGGVSSTAIDETMTIVGRDETILALPPQAAVPLVLPELDDTWMVSPGVAAVLPGVAAVPPPYLPPVKPPPAYLPFPLSVPDPRDILSDALAR